MWKDKFGGLGFAPGLGLASRYRVGEGLVPLLLLLLLLLRGEPRYGRGGPAERTKGPVLIVFQ